MKRIIKHLIDENIIDFQALVLKYYTKLKISEKEAIALIKLQALIEEHEQIIKPARFSKWMNLSEKETEDLLNQLIEKGFLDIGLIKQDDGKETEAFNIDYFITKITKILEKETKKYDQDIHFQYVSFLEDSLQKPLNPLEVEIVSKWIHDEEYPLELVKEATLEALKKTNPSIRLIDQILLNDVEDIKVKPQRKKDVLKDFHSLWDE